MFKYFKYKKKTYVLPVISLYRGLLECNRNPLEYCIIYLSFLTMMYPDHVKIDIYDWICILDHISYIQIAL